MDARTPPPIALKDLDRDELLQLIDERFRGHGRLFTLYDLWSARWEVAARRSKAIDAETQPLRDAYYATFATMPPAGERALRRWLKDRAAKRAAYDTAERRRKRAENAEERAWKALEASRWRG